jgi:peptide/nickel transport system substrate-binding protein
MRPASPLRRLLGRRTLLAGVGLLTAGALIAGCGGADTADPGAPARDTLVVLTADQVSNVTRDFAFTSGYDNQDVTANLHASLIRNPYVQQEGGNALAQDAYHFEPVLAESYAVAPDEMSISFVLKQGVKSQQGNELTSEDVVWSFARKLATPGGGMPSYYRPMLTDPAQVVAVDKYTVRFDVKRPSDVFTLLSNLGNNIGAIYDSTYLKANATPADPYAVEWQAADIMRGNIGFGPYKLQSITAGQETVLTANPDYVLGAPAIKTIIRRVVADPATRASILKAGDADVAVNLRPSDQVTMERDENLFVPTGPTAFYTVITLNTKQAPFDNTLLRQAMSYAIPYDKINSDVFFGRAYTYTHMLDDKAPNYDGSALPNLTFDPAKAKELLAQAGMPNGFEFTLSVNAALPAVVDTAIQIQSFAKEAGITVNIAQLPAAQLNTDINQGKTQASMNQGSSSVQSPVYALQLLTNPSGAGNTAKWTDTPESIAFNAELTRGLDSGDVLGPEAMKSWNSAEVMLTEAAPYIWINRTYSHVTLKSDIKGFAQRTDPRIDYGELTIG